MSVLFQLLFGLICLLATPCHAFVAPLGRQSVPKWRKDERERSVVVSLPWRSATARRMADDEDRDSSLDKNKFGFGQRIDSLKSLVVGALAGSVAGLPFLALHDLVLQSPQIITNGIAQWEFDNDMAALQTGLFAIVYRYCIREDVGNPQLNQGVVAAFAITRTLSRIVVPTYCSAIPLSCMYATV